MRIPLFPVTFANVKCYHTNKHIFDHVFLSISLSPKTNWKLHCNLTNTAVTEDNNKNKYKKKMQTPNAFWVV